MIPLRFVEIGADESRLLFVADTGRSFFGTPSFLDRYVRRALTPVDSAFLDTQGLNFVDGDLAHTNYLYQLNQRLSVRRQADYFILVLTLRCNLACSYCQVARADLDARGFDWNNDIAERAIDFIAANSPKRVKIEFQGGEPTLRLDLVKSVLAALEGRGKEVEAVICTNLMEFSSEFERLIARDNVFLSTSIDGSTLRQTAQRTHSEESAARFFSNVERILSAFGPGKLSALPTIDPENPPSYQELYDAFAGRGLRSIFLRPINFHGFARKRHGASRERRQRWSAYYRGFIRFLIEIGKASNYAVSEFYFTQCLRRIFSRSANGHVDLRNPSILGVDYFVINYDGKLFPTDEARMLDRIGEIDLSIGDIWNGVDFARRDALNQTAFNDEDPDCIHCAFQPFCGGDVVDAVSRHGRAELPRFETAFCQNQLDVFDLIFSLLADESSETRAALSAWLGLAEPVDRFLDQLHD